MLGLLMKEAGCKYFMMHIGWIDNTDEQPSYYIKTLANSIWKLLFVILEKEIASSVGKDGMGEGGLFPFTPFL